MLDAAAHTAKATDTTTETCDLCVIGAGIAGLNALHVATDYLGPDAKVILIDRNPAPGGMWTQAYDYVRLHQPHPMFTTGDNSWDWKRPPEYLAARDEVQGHLARCMTIAGERVRFSARFGTEFVSAEEVDTPQGPRARITCRQGDATLTIDAGRMINAIGFNIQPVPPLSLSSDQVTSTAPEALSSDGTLTSDAPVIVVGGGKTGMDTCMALLRQNPARNITLLSGRGTFFACRDTLLPLGARRWWSGHRVLTVFRDIGMTFDGDNEDLVRDHARTKYGLSPTPNAQQFLYGLLSKAECETITRGITENIGDYLTDIIDGPDGPVMTLRRGAERPVAPGTIVINCTGHILRGSHPEQQALSPRGTILSITERDSMHFLTSVCGYFLTHLWFLGLIKTAPIYMLDNEVLFKANRNAWIAATSAQALANTATLIQSVPFKVADSCGLDFDRWYPLPRRIASLIDIKMNHKRYVTHCHKVLDRVRERYNVPGGVLSDR